MEVGISQEHMYFIPLLFEVRSLSLCPKEKNEI